MVKLHSVVRGLLVLLVIAVLATAAQAQYTGGPVGPGPVPGGGGGAVASVTGGGNTTCSPTTGSVVCTTTAGAAPAGSAGDLQTYATSSTFGHLTPGGAVASALAVAVGSAGSFVVNGGALGTPSSGVATNLTGTAAGLTAGHVTTNANLTGPVTSVGNATTFVGPLPATGVTAGSYTASNLTVGADGRITAAANGSGGGTHGAHYQSASLFPSGPSTSTPYHMQGLAGAITPALSGNVLIIINGTIFGTTPTAAGDGIQFQIAFGTGTAPANNAAASGTVIGPAIFYTNPNTAVSGDIAIPFSISAVATGLTLSTAYWIDLQAEYISAAGMKLFPVTISAVELP